MFGETQRVVVIHDAAREVSMEAIKRVLKSLSLKAGDQLTILAILDRFSSPMGYKIRVDSNSFIATNQKIIGEELSRKKEEYPNIPEIMKLSKKCERKKIVFGINVQAGHFPEVAVYAARNLRATWLILDREMYKYRRQLKDRLPCGMYRIASDNSLEKLKELELTANSKLLAERPSQVRYMDMIPGTPEERISAKRHKPSSSSEKPVEMGIQSVGGKYELQSKEGQNSSIIEQETERHCSLFHIPKNREQKQHSGDNEAAQMEVDFTKPLCSVCKDKRPMTGWKSDFTYAELYAATSGFSQKNFISEGGFGSVYKGFLNGITIAVKQHKNANLQGEKEFKSEVNVLSTARHENVVMLLGSCSEGNNRLLVYEYVCNGSLDQHLSQHSRMPLSWEDRIKVAIGAAKGLLYLHENNIIHRDLRPNNILITHDNQPLLGDFGLARTQNVDSIHSTEVIGSFGYLAPEYAEYGKVSAKTDIYSFGLVLLELLTGMKTTDKRLGGRSLVGWARPLLKERNYPDLIDERIMNSPDFHQLFWMVRLAEKCLSRDPQKRLSMSSVVSALNRIVEGRTCGTVIRDYSPARSESSYTSEDSAKSEDSMQCSFEIDGGEGSLSSDSGSFSSISHMILRPPPSPPMIGGSSSSGLNAFKVYDEFPDRRTDTENYAGLSQNRDELVYEAMVE